MAAFGDTFSVIGAREPQPGASEVFTSFGDAHRTMEKNGVRMLRTLKPVSGEARSAANYNAKLWELG